MANAKLSGALLEWENSRLATTLAAQPGSAPRKASIPNTLQVPDDGDEPEFARLMPVSRRVAAPLGNGTQGRNLGRIICGGLAACAVATAIAGGMVLFTPATVPSGLSAASPPNRAAAAAPASPPGVRVLEPSAESQATVARASEAATDPAPTVSGTAPKPLQTASVVPAASAPNAVAAGDRSALTVDPVPAAPASSAADRQQPPNAAAALSAPQPKPGAAGDNPGLAVDPPPAAADQQPLPTAATRLSAETIGTLLARGDALLVKGDIASARLFYQRAAEGGDPQAVLRLQFLERQAGH